MAHADPSWQELIRQRARAGFVGREAERALFTGNFDIPAGDARRRFRFHVHGSAGVGKTFLIQELAQLARDRGALTAYVDEGAGSVPEALDVLCRQFADQGRRLKELERRLTSYRERRHEAQAAAVAALAAEPEGPSDGGRAAVELGLGLLDTAVPGAGLVTRAVPVDRLAQGADRLRAGLSARFRSPEDVDLVLTPEKVLTPVLLDELRAAASAVPGIVLFFDTYERTGPFLDPWLYDVLTQPERYGGLPAAVVVVTAGQRPLPAARWSGLDSVTEVPLAPFTDAEARDLLAARGVVAEPVVAEVLRLTGGLPVLVSTLAEARPGGLADVGDPSATAVERFLRWEGDPVRRRVALTCALPRRLDADVFRALVDCPDDEADALYDWLRSLPFVVEHGGWVRYHDVVRAPMLRLERRRSPRGWAARQRRLAEAFAAWRAEVEGGRDAEELWADEEWRELRLAEAYHRLCAGAREALPEVLREFVAACDAGDTVAVRWARALAEAGEDAGAGEAGRWGSELGGALAEGGVPAALGLLVRAAGFDAAAKARALTVRGGALRDSGAHEEALVEYGRAVALDPGHTHAHRGRARTHAELGDYAAAVADLDRALALTPDDARWLAVRGEYHRAQGHHDEAVRDLDEAIRLDPALDFAWASRGATRLRHGDPRAALADLDRALELNPEYPWALARRARVWRALGEPERQLADLDRALTVDPDWAWGLCERGDALRAVGRCEDSLADLDRALALDPGYVSARASRGATLAVHGRCEEALAELDRVLAARPAYTWALVQRTAVHRALGAEELAAADEERAGRLDGA
ncbi:tetratricopeptide repeat protein [Streptomyces sp. NPDC003635]